MKRIKSFKVFFGLSTLIILVILFFQLNTDIAFSQTCQNHKVICDEGKVPCCEKFKPHCKDGEPKCCKKKDDDSLKCKDKEGNTYPVECKDSCDENIVEDDESESEENKDKAGNTESTGSEVTLREQVATTTTPQCPNGQPCGNICCSAPTPICNTNIQICVQCTSNSHCSGNTPICDQRFICVQCSNSTDCNNNSNGKVCDPITRTCKQCLVGYDVTACNGSACISDVCCSGTEPTQCGNTCCPTGQCANPATSTCCKDPVNPRCGAGCCDSAQCARDLNAPLSQGVCCSTAYPRCGNTCCASAQCSVNDNGVGTCCTDPARPKCSNTCCPTGQCTTDGICCIDVPPYNGLSYSNNNGVCCLPGYTGCRNYLNPANSRCCDTSRGETCTPLLGVCNPPPSTTVQPPSAGTTVQPTTPVTCRIVNGICENSNGVVNGPCGSSAHGFSCYSARPGDCSCQ